MQSKNTQRNNLASNTGYRGELTFTLLDQKSVSHFYYLYLSLNLESVESNCAKYVCKVIATAVVGFMAHTKKIVQLTNYRWGKYFPRYSLLAVVHPL